MEDEMSLDEKGGWMRERKRSDGSCVGRRRRKSKVRYGNRKDRKSLGMAYFFLRTFPSSFMTSFILPLAPELRTCVVSVCWEQYKYSSGRAEELEKTIPGLLRSTVTKSRGSHPHLQRCRLAKKKEKRALIGHPDLDTYVTMLKPIEVL